MRKLIASMMLTLDGVMEAPGGEPGHPHSGWVHPPANEEFLQYKLNETLGAESLHLARAGGARTGKMPMSRWGDLSFPTPAAVGPSSLARAR
jgi:hypothetical protein